VPPPRFAKKLFFFSPSSATMLEHREVSAFDLKLLATREAQLS
jgi:hypothetical protein